MKVIIQNEMDGGGHITNLYPATDNAGFKELKELIIKNLNIELVRDNPDITEAEELEENGTVSYNEEKVSISDDEANAEDDMSVYTWEIAKIDQEPIHLTVVIQDGRVYTVYADQPGVVDFEVLDLDTDDDDQAAANCSIMDSMRNRCYEVGKWCDEPNE